MNNLNDKKENFPTNEQENPASKLWSLIIYKTDDMNIDLVFSILVNLLNKTEEQAFLHIGEIGENGSTVIASYIQEIAATIKDRIEKEVLHQDSSFQITMGPE